MSNLTIGLKMLTPVDQFKDKVVREMYKVVSKKLSSAAFQASIKRGAKRILSQSLIVQPEYQSMVTQDGILRTELGVKDSASAMNNLVRDWVRSTHIQIARPRIIGHRIAGTIIRVKAIEADYQDVLDKAYASYTTEQGQTIPWLEWLLTQGSEILVFTHKVMNIPSARSRTGSNVIMVKSKGRGWGVPIEYSGTPDNNYATRAVVTAMPAIERLFETEVRRRL